MMDAESCISDVESPRIDINWIEADGFEETVLFTSIKSQFKTGKLVYRHCRKHYEKALKPNGEIAMLPKRGGPHDGSAGVNNLDNPYEVEVFLIELSESLGIEISLPMCRYLYTVLISEALDELEGHWDAPREQ